MKKIYDIIKICENNMYCVVMDDNIVFTTHSVQLDYQSKNIIYIYSPDITVDLTNKNITVYHTISNNMHYCKYYSIETKVAMKSNTTKIYYKSCEENEMTDVKKFLNRYETINNLLDEENI